MIKSTPRTANIFAISRPMPLVAPVINAFTTVPPFVIFFICIHYTDTFSLFQFFKEEQAEKFFLQTKNPCAAFIQQRDFQCLFFIFRFSVPLSLRHILPEQPVRVPVLQG